jgi:glycosyltransferase involved in cell wall biosynthesis
MRIAFYAPLKAPGHLVPSGDRQMSRLLIAALRRSGHTVEVASTLRAFLSEHSTFAEREARAHEEIARLDADWVRHDVPDMWFCYHPYYKAPDLIGPALARRFAIPYVTAEASYAGKRNADRWAIIQARVVACVKLAAVNLCFTQRDRDGLVQVAPEAVFADLKPFIDTAPFAAQAKRSSLPKLVAVAMMRQGDKLRSFTMLAAALELIADTPWHLTVVGDGPARREVEALFRRFDPARIAWTGEACPEDIPRHLHDGDLYVWPGCGEAYGLAYLEAQAAGLPVVAQNTAGVPEVVLAGETGLLTPTGDIVAYANAIRRLLSDDPLRTRMSTAARKFVHEERSLAPAAVKLDAILRQSIAQ